MIHGVEQYVELQAEALISSSTREPSMMRAHFAYQQQWYPLSILQWMLCKLYASLPGAVHYRAFMLPPLKEMALPSLGSALASWLASCCPHPLSPSAPGAEKAFLQGGSSAAAAPTLALTLATPIVLLYLAASALAVLALLVLPRTGRRGTAAVTNGGSVGGDGAYVQRARNSCCRCGGASASGSCDTGGAAACDPLGQRWQGWARRQPLPPQPLRPQQRSSRLQQCLSQPARDAGRAQGPAASPCTAGGPSGRKSRDADSGGSQTCCIGATGLCGRAAHYAVRDACLVAPADGRCGDGATVSSVPEVGGMPAGRSRRYCWLTRLTSTRVKIQGGGVQPEHIVPGYQQRIAEVVGAAGRTLEGVYVRRGCIELIVDSYGAEAPPPGPGPGPPLPRGQEVSDAVPIVAGGSGLARPPPADALVGALGLPPSDTAHPRHHTARVWNSPAPAGWPAAVGSTACTSRTHVRHCDETGGITEEQVAPPPPQPAAAGRVASDDTAAVSGGGLRRGDDEMLLQVEPRIVSLVTAGGAVAKPHSGGSGGVAVGDARPGGDGGAGRPPAVLSVWVWSPYCSVPQVTARFGGRFLRARVQLEAVDFGLRGVPAPDLGAEQRKEEEMGEMGEREPLHCYRQEQQQRRRRPCSVPADAAGGSRGHGDNRIIIGGGGEGSGGGGLGDCAGGSSPYGFCFAGTVELIDLGGADSARRVDTDHDGGGGCATGARGGGGAAGLMLLQAHSPNPPIDSPNPPTDTLDGAGQAAGAQGAFAASRPVPVLWVDDPRVGGELQAGAADPAAAAGLSSDDLEGLLVDMGVFLSGARHARAAAAAAKSSAAFGAVCGATSSGTRGAAGAEQQRSSLLNLRTLGDHLMQWVAADADAAPAGLNGCSGGADAWSATLERLRSDLDAIQELLDADGGEVDGGRWTVGCSLPEDLSAACGGGVAQEDENAGVADCRGKTGKNAAAGAEAATGSCSSTGVPSSIGVPSRPAAAVCVQAAAVGGGGVSLGRRSVWCSARWMYDRLYDPGYQAFLVDYCASTAHVVDAMTFLSIGGLLLRTWQEEPAWRHRPPAAFLAHMVPPLTILTTSLATTVAWGLLPRSSWAQFVRGAQWMRYLSFLLGLLLLARPGAEAPPAIAIYHMRAGSVMLGEGVVLAATVVVMPVTAVLLAVLRLPAHVLVWRKLRAHGDTLASATALAVALACVSVAINLLLHACLLTQYTRRCRLLQERQRRGKAG